MNIPKSVLELLAHEWAESGSFESAFEGRAIKSPSYYTIAAGRKVDTNFDTLSNAEAAAMVRESVFGEFAKISDSGAVIINEHAQHALTDFAAETYEAWARYQKRLMQIRAVGNPPVN